MQIKRLPKRVSHLVKSGDSIVALTDVCRELVENSIDAKSHNISIEIKLDCKSNTISIICKDDGSGISKDNLRIIGERYCTSKLPNEVLTEVKTMGFRGEALNSIMSVSSKCVITSRVFEFNGGFDVLFVNGERIGNVISHFNVIDVGTIVKLDGLFHNVKVRRELILNESPLKLANDLKMMVFKSFINYANVKLDLKLTRMAVDGSTITKRIGFNGLKYKFGKLQNQMKMLQNLFGDVSKTYEVIKVQFQDLKLEVCMGFSVSQSKQFQFVFLNGRPFENSKLISAITKRYQTGYDLWQPDNLKMFGKPFSTNAVFIGNFETNKIEVNDLIQHPGKISMESKWEKIMIKLFEKATDLFFKIQGKEKKIDEVKHEQKETQQNIKRMVPILKSGMRVSNLKNMDKLLDVDPSVEINHNVLNIDRFDQELQAGIAECNNCNENSKQLHYSQSINDRKTSMHFRQYKEVEIARESFKQMEVIGQCDNKYIIAKLGNNIIALDQHGCDERVRVERQYRQIAHSAMQLSSVKRDVLFKMEKPITIEFTSHEQELVEEYSRELERWGVRIKDGEFITHLPELIRNRSSAVLHAGLCEYLFSLESGRKSAYINRTADWPKVVQNSPQLIQEAAKIWACRGAVMFGKELDRMACEELLKGLSICDSPHFCAHGRLIFIVLKTGN